MKMRASIFSVLLGSAILNPLLVMAETINDIPDIVVTAQKREQKAQDIPVSLSVIAAEDIERQGIASVQEMGNSAAGVNISGINPGALQLTIRGAGDLSSSNQAASVNGLYIDETVMSYVPGYMPEVSLVDIERVEILRGPQGTLFGDGSEGGTMRIITRKPDSARSFGRIKAGAYSTRNGAQGYGLQGNVNVPLVKDVLAVTVAGGYRDLPGWIDVPDIGVKDSNKSELTDGRIAVRYTPLSNLTIDAFYQIGRSTINDFITTERFQLNPNNLNPRLGPVAGLSPSEGRLDVGALTISYAAGAVTLVSASSLTKSSFDSTRDLTSIFPAVGLPAAILPRATAQSVYLVNSEAFTQELRLSSNGSDKLVWTVGGYFKHEKRNVDDGYVFNVPVISIRDNPFSQSEQSGDAWAVFGDADYRLTDSLSLQAGLRYFEDDKNFEVQQVTGSALLGFPATPVQLGQDNSRATSPKIGLTYAFSPESLVFAKYSRGFRSGGANTAPLSTYPSATKQFGPESIEAFEIGLKTNPAAGWTVNVYAYHNNWNDVQMPFYTVEVPAYFYVRNAGDAKTDGAEVEISGKISPYLDIAMTYAYNKSRITGNVDRNASGIAIGNEVPFNSKQKLTLAAHHHADLASGLQLSLDGRYRLASKTFSDPANTPEFANAQTSQLYLSGGIAGGWGAITLFVDNVFDRADTVAKGPAKVPLFAYSNFLRPRNFGLEFKREF